MNIEKSIDDDQMLTAQNGEVAPAENESSETGKSHLSAPLWSVVSFNGCAESGLSYYEAMAEMAQLATENVPGLCIITDDAAANIGK